MQQNGSETCNRHYITTAQQCHLDNEYTQSSNSICKNYKSHHYSW